MEAFLHPTAPLAARPFLGRPPSRTRRPATRRLHAPTATAQLPDVVVIGGGLAGLSTAHELAQRGASVRVLTSPVRRAAGFAAAGMLAPAAEALSPPLRALCEHSLHLYPRFIRTLQPHATAADLRYVSLPDFLRPHLPAAPRPAPAGPVLSGAQARAVEPALGPAVTSAERLLGQAHVDSRALMDALRAACAALGVDVRNAPVRRLAVAPGGAALDGAVLASGDTERAGHFVLAAGAWAAALLPGLPLRPIKGQMLSLRPPHGEEARRLRHVLYTDDVYIVPKRDGEEFYVGATCEEGTFDLANTAGGVARLLNEAARLVPALEHYEIVETWSGLRPATPDLAPILGMSELSNLSLATGYYRNGFLLAPVAAKIAAATALGEMDTLPAELRELAGHFSIGRFLGESGRVDASVGTGAAVEQSVRKSGRDEVNRPEGNVAQLRDQLHADGESQASQDDLSEVKVWKVLPNGSREPVVPSAEYLARERSKLEGQEAKPMQNHPPVVASYANAQTTTEPDSAGVPDDAYEDVKQRRGEEDGQIMSKAMAANRAFGREKSSLEKDGSPVLSLSEEDVKQYDAALQHGLEDFKEMEGSFDENHPSVVASQAELARLSEEQGREVHAVNGVANPRFDRQVGSSETPGPSGYY